MLFNPLGNKSSQVKGHDSKARTPIISNVEGKCKEPVKDKHVVNALSPISFTPSGMYKEPVRDVQSQNALDAIPISLSGKIRCVNVFFIYLI